MLMGAFLSLNILVTCGCSLPSFSIKTFGLVGLTVESGNKGEEVKTVYRVFDLASAMMDQGRYLNTASDLVGLGTLASLLVITVFIVPLAQAASLLAEWFAPMTVRQRLKSEAANEIFSSWQYMDVYVLSIVITGWHIGDLSEFMAALCMKPSPPCPTMVSSISRTHNAFELMQLLRLHHGSW